MPQLDQAGDQIIVAKFFKILKVMSFFFSF